MLTSGGIAFLRDLLAGLNPPTVSAIAIGSGTAPLGSFMTALPGEAAQIPLIGAVANGTSVVFEAYATTSVANVSFRSYGLYAGSVLIAASAVPVPFGKTSANALPISFPFTISGTIATRAFVTSGGIALLCRALAGTDTITAPFYVALGSGMQTLTRFMSTTPGETVRLPSVATQVDGASAVVNYYMEADNIFNQTQACYGVVGGLGATAQPNTGTVLALASEPYPFAKTSANALAGTFILTVSGSLG